MLTLVSQSNDFAESAGTVGAEDMSWQQPRIRNGSLAGLGVQELL